MPTKRIYLAGPMTGLPEYNYPTFNAEAARLRALGYHVENPAENPEQSSWEDYLRQAIRQMLTCDMVALLPGWEGSRGAGFERSVALQVGMALVMADQVTGIPTAPTVKAEQRDDGGNIQHLTDCDVSGCERCENLMYFYQACDECGVWGHNDAGPCACQNKAPSLPAAGSAVEEVEVVGTRYVAFSESGRKISLVRLSRKRRPGWQQDDLMTVAQHERIVAALRAQIVERDAQIEEWSGTAVQNGMEVDRLNAALSAQQSAPERVSVPGKVREAVGDSIAEALGDAYDCTRVWSAWGVGTMSQDDFHLITDDASRIGELADAAISAILSHQRVEA